ncbi:MAG: hypothetical protein KBC46_03530 [Ferrovibrio sp.]|nr:hypothetical protein [Ferrovibrio sp.]
MQFIQLAALPALGGLWWYARQAHERAEAARAVAEEKAAKVLAELNAYKLQAAKEFATIGYLKDVELRMLSAMNEIKDAVKEISRHMRHQAGE